MLLLSLTLLKTGALCLGSADGGAYPLAKNLVSGRSPRKIP